MTQEECKERDAAIVKMYVMGVTQDNLASHFDISRARVGQILYDAGALTSRRPHLKSIRTRFIGVHLSEGVKLAFKRVAESEGKSMSKLLSELVITDLRTRGVAIVEPGKSNEEDVPLPLGQ